MRMTETAIGTAWHGDSIHTLGHLEIPGKLAQQFLALGFSLAMIEMRNRLSLFSQLEMVKD